MTSKQKIIVSVTNDLTTDQRVSKICNTLLELNFEVLLVGRKLPTSLPFNKKEYQTKRFRLLFNKGPLFYINYNLRLFFFLLFTRHTSLWSNDLDTLLANFLVSRIKKTKLIFDSHEYFTEVPELINRPSKQKIWKKLEQWILPKLSNVTTVSPSIANLYQKEYGVNVQVVRNLPLLENPLATVPNIKIDGKKIILYQGAINVNRGIESMVKAMQFVDDAFLYLIGDGDIFNQIQDLIDELKLNNKVKMLGKIPFEQLPGYTQQANIGLSLEEDKGLNYRFALPNKLFDYIHAGLPVLVSNLPEMAKIIEQYQVGEILDQHDAKGIAEKLASMINDNEKLKLWQNNSLKAAKKLCWENEKEIIYSLFNSIK